MDSNYRGTILELPENIRIEIDTLILFRHYSYTRLKRAIESKFNIKLPSSSSLAKYVVWRRTYPHIDKVIEPPATPVTPTVQETIIDNNIKKNREISKNFNTVQPQTTEVFSNPIEDLKARTLNRINALETSQKNTYDKYTENTLKGYYEVYRQLIHSDVKLADDLKDSDKISIAEVRVSMTRVFSIIYSIIDKMMPGRANEFKNDLEEALKRAKSEFLNDNKIPDVKTKENPIIENAREYDTSNSEVA